MVVDCAHGAAYEVSPSAIWELGANVIAIGVSPNGTNINDGVGSTSLDAMRERVVEEGADIGIALDGDADRLIVIDEKGKVAKVIAKPKVADHAKEVMDGFAG